MYRTRAAIYASANDKHQANSQVMALQKAIQNDGCHLPNSVCRYTDIGATTDGLAALIEDAKVHKFQVLYVNYTSMPNHMHQHVKDIVRLLYTYGVSAIVCVD